MSHFTVLVIGEDVEEALAPFQENNMGDCPKEYLKFYAYGSDEKEWFENEDEAKEFLGDKFDEDEACWENTNSQWDWYQIGGRWQGLLQLKENAKSGIVGEKSLLDNDKRIRGFDSARIKDIDFNNNDMKDFVTFAVLKDGKWNDRDSMGWWSTVLDEKENDKWQEEFNNILKSLDENTRITVVDCHI